MAANDYEHLMQNLARKMMSNADKKEEESSFAQKYGFHPRNMYYPPDEHPSYNIYHQQARVFSTYEARQKAREEAYSKAKPRVPPILKLLTDMSKELGLDEPTECEKCGGKMGPTERATGKNPSTLYECRDNQCTRVLFNPVKIDTNVIRAYRTILDIAACKLHTASTTRDDHLFLLKFMRTNTLVTRYQPLVAWAILVQRPLFAKALTCSP